MAFGTNGDEGFYGGVAGGDLRGRVGDYEIVSVLGTGTYGKVYHAIELYSRHHVALKKIYGQSAIDRYKWIIRVLGGLDSDSSLFANPRRVFIAGETDYVSDGGLAQGDMVVEMDLAQGVPADLWADPNTPGSPEWCEKVFDVCMQLGAALDALHDQDLLHRDISPANIIVQDDGIGQIFAHICDFDQVVARKELSMPVPVVGTPNYIAPEVLARLSLPDSRSDQYSLACVMYRLLAGKAPFGYRSADLQTKSVSTADPQSFMAIRRDGAIWKLLSACPRPVRCLNARQNAALAKALSVNQELRYSTCVNMVSAVMGATHEKVKYP